MNIKKLFSVAAVVTFVGSTFLNGLALAATPDTELGKAYEWAHSKGITTMDTYEAANMDKPITRAQMAKMLSVYAMSELGMKPDTTKTECNEFNDIANITGDLHEYIITSCQLGLMGQQIFSGIKEFRPNANISRAEFGTALSRTLWGGKYEGGTPYYANHLQALQSAGIMKIIANAETTQEIRGYVMLMLMRSAEGSEAKADCEDPMIKAACLIDDDSCPAECKETSDEKEDTVVKSGDLAVTAESAANRKILKTGISDLDTITFKTSEDVTISKITLERYGYSKAEQIEGIWLEDQDGNVIAESKTLTKDKVTLNLKKDYRTVDGKFVATVVVETKDAEGTIGFKVTDAESTAKNLNLDDYSPYTYDVVAYVGSEVTVEMKGSDKKYNYEEGESYEIARVKVSAGDSAVIVKGFTLTNAGKVDMKESLDKLTITLDSKEVKAKYSVNKDDELVINFEDEVELGINKRGTFILSATFKDFDDYGQSVKYYIAESSDFNAVESKNGTRANLSWENAKSTSKTLATYTFNGGKIKLSNKKLGNVDAAQASEGIVIAEGDITVTEPISKINFSISVDSPYIDKLTMIVNGDEFDGTDKEVTVAEQPIYNFTSKPSNDKCDWTSAGTAQIVLQDNKVSKDGYVKVLVDADNDDFDGTYFVKASSLSKSGGPYDLYDANKALVPACEGENATYSHIIISTVGLESSAEGTTTFNFKNVSIEKSGKIQFTVDIADDELAAGYFTITPAFGKTQLAGAKYDNVSKQYVDEGDVAGSISFSKVTIQPAKAALENNVTKEVEYIKGESARKVVFDGTYTARKADIDLNKFTIEGTKDALGADNKVTFYLFVDGEEVGDTDVLGSEESFSDVRVEAGKSVKVKVEAEVEAYGDEHPAAVVYTLALKGTDMNGNEDTGRGSDALVGIKIKGKGGVTVEKTKSNNTINLKKANSELATFNISPSNGNEDVLIEDILLKVEKLDDDGNVVETLAGDAIRVKVDGVEQYDPTTETSTIDSKKYLSYDVNETINAKTTVSISLRADISGKYRVTIRKINENTTLRTYNKYFVPAVVLLTKQEDLDGTTKFTYEVTDKSDSDYTISDFCLYEDIADVDIAAHVTDTTTALGCKAGDIEGDNLYFEAEGIMGSVQFVKAASYVVDTDEGKYDVIVDYDTYSDYFSINGADARVYKSKM